MMEWMVIIPREIGSFCSWFIGTVLLMTVAVSIVLRVKDYIDDKIKGV